MTVDEVWKLPEIVSRYLSYRAAIPLAQEQIGVMISILKSRREPVESFLDLGCGDGILGAAILGEYPSARGLLVDFSEGDVELRVGVGIVVAVGNGHDDDHARVAEVDAGLAEDAARASQAVVK